MGIRKIRQRVKATDNPAAVKNVDVQETPDPPLGFIGLFVDSLDVAASFASAVELDSVEPQVGHDDSSVPLYLSAQWRQSRGC